MTSDDTITELPISESIDARAESFDGCWKLELSGSVTTDIDPAPLRELEAESVLFDLDGITRITSYGIREWVGLMNELDTPYYGFVHVRPPVITQFNMVYNFGGDGEIISLYLPYYCPKCGENFTECVDLRHDYGALSGFDVPSPDCPECDDRAQFDGVPEAYLEYVNQQGAPTPPAAIERVIDGTDESDGRTPGRAPFRIRKEIVEDVTALWASGRLDSNIRARRFAQGLEGTLLLICSELTHIDPDTFRELLDLLDEELLLARVSRPLIEPLAETPDLGDELRPVTTIQRAECTNCGWSSEAEFELLQLADVDGPDDPEGCPECFGDLVADISDEDRAFYRSFDPPPAPKRVAQYLSHCESGPDARRQTDDFERVIGQSFGQYELQEKIGSGGMAEIFRATKSGAENFRREVVIKRLLLEKSDSPNLVKSLKREAELAARLTHPNIVQVTDFGRTNQFYYIAMEYIDGPDLGVVLEHARRNDELMPVDLALFLTSRVCEALGAAHQLTDAEGDETPVVHRDVSPENILVSPHGTPKLTDFGIARVVTDLQQDNQEPVRGKASFLSPEAIKPELGPIDGRSDIFSLGTVLYHCLTGEAPYQRRGQQATLRAILLDSPPVPSALRDNITDELDQLVSKALAKRPDDRFGSAHDFLVAIEEVLQDYGVVTERKFGEWVDRITAAPAAEERDRQTVD